MAENEKKVPEEGPKGVDRWTSNGYGLRVNGKNVTPPDQEDENQEEIDEIEEM